jgi:hypothetical protein
MKSLVAMEVNDCNGKETVGMGIVGCYGKSMVVIAGQ